jgi:CheY-like chemotaxis protein
MTSFQGSLDRRPRVLLVDDQDYFRDALYTVLERHGYEVLAASNGPDGLTICRQSIRPIELLVTDYNMPQMSGLELARECVRLYRELSVLYVSGARPNEDLQADLQEPNRAFLAKPFRRDDLLRKAKELLPVESTGRLSVSV